MIQFCRTCLCALNDDASYFALDTSETASTENVTSIRSKLLFCIPELMLEVVTHPVICQSCIEALNVAYNFKRNCLHVEDRILRFSRMINCSRGTVNISELLHHEEQERAKGGSFGKTPELCFVQIQEQDAPVLNGSNYASVKVKRENTEDQNRGSQLCLNAYDEPSLTQSEFTFGPELDVTVLDNRGVTPGTGTFGAVHDSTSTDENFFRDYRGMTNDGRGAPFTCPYCYESFFELSQFEMHQAIHADTKPLKCTECDKRFVRKDKLTLHMRIHTGEKPFPCSICGRCFSRKDKLKNHTRTHTGEKPHQCILCRKCFARKDKMNSHMKTQHWMALSNLEISVVSHNDAEENVNNLTVARGGIASTANE